VVGELALFAAFVIFAAAKANSSSQDDDAGDEAVEDTAIEKGIMLQATELKNKKTRRG
jgi:hypothetical protein